MPERSREIRERAPDEVAPQASRPDESVDRPGRSIEGNGFLDAHGAEQNRLLRALPIEDYEALLPRLVPVRLELKQVLIEPDIPIRDVYFLREGVCSFISEQQEHGSVEVGTIGRDGLIGIPVLLGAQTIPYKVFVQIEGQGVRMPADEFRQLVDDRPTFRNLLLRYTQYWTDQLSQSVACNRLHTLDERCARWLLLTYDRVEGDNFELTHEFLSLMLGVRRAGVTVAMGALQSQRILSYVRGRVHILDRPRLEEASCNCYHITRSQLQRLLGQEETG